MGLSGDIESYTETPSDVRELLVEDFMKKIEKEALIELQANNEEVEEVEENVNTLRGKRAAVSSESIKYQRQSHGFTTAQEFGGNYPIGKEQEANK